MFKDLSIILIIIISSLSSFDQTNKPILHIYNNSKKLDKLKEQIKSFETIKFSDSVTKMIDLGGPLNIRTIFELETKGIDKTLALYNNKLTFDIKTKKGRKNFIKSIRKDLFPLMPKEFFFSYNKDGSVKSSVFTYSNANYGLSMTNKAEAAIYNEFKKQIFALGKEGANVNFGEGVVNADWNSTKTYSTIFGKKNNYLQKIEYFHKNLVTNFQLYMDQYIAIQYYQD